MSIGSQATAMCVGLVPQLAVSSLAVPLLIGVISVAPRGGANDV
jgi:hypothetical protein